MKLHAPRRFTFITALVTLLILLFSPQALGAGFFLDGLEAPTSNGEPNAWWVDWLAAFDLNANRIDDEAESVAQAAIDAGTPDGLVPVLVSFAQSPVDLNGLIDHVEAAPDAYLFKTVPLVDLNLPARNLARLQTVPGVVAVEYDRPVYPLLDVSAPAMQANNGSGANTFYNGMTAEDLGYTGEGMVVAVLDTGVQDSQTAFAGKWIAGTDVSPQIPVGTCFNPSDDAGHGTHVASTVLGQIPDNALFGTAKTAKLVEVKIAVGGATAEIEPATIGSINRGFEFVALYNDELASGTPLCGPDDDHIDVATLSFGSPDRGGPNAGSTEAFVDALVISGVAVTIAVGNCGPEASGTCLFSDDDNGISSPGNAAGAIGVASFNDGGTVSRANDTISGFSSRGPNAASTADPDPGAAGGATSAANLQDRHRKPDLAAPGAGIEAAGLSDGVTAEMTGTSMATPHVAGVAALLLQAGEEVKDQTGGVNRMASTGNGFVDNEYVVGAYPVRDALVHSTDYKSAGAKDLWTGPNSNNVQWNNAWGYGQGDAFDALCWAWKNVLLPSGATPPTAVDALCGLPGGVPVANDDSAVTTENESVNINVLANDDDEGHPPLTVTSATDPPNGSTTINPDGTITYQPDENLSGTDAFDYSISNGEGLTDTGRVTVTINPFCPFLPEGSFSDDLEPTPELGWGGNSAGPGIPFPIWTHLTDPSAHSASHSFFSEAESLNKDDRLVAPAQDLSATSQLSFWHRFSFEQDFDGGVLEVSKDGGATWQDVVTAGGSFVQGGYNGTIDPDFESVIAGRTAWTGFSGSDTEMNNVIMNVGALAGFDVFFRWRLATDGAFGDTGWFLDDVEFTNLLVLSDCNHPPIARSDMANVTEGESVTITVLGNDVDPDGDSLGVTSVTDPPNGTAEVNPDNTITYTPDTGPGSDTFEYTITDNNGGFDTARVNVTIIAASNGPPVANDDTAATPKNNAVVIPILVNDSDPDGDTLSVTSVTDPPNGATVNNNDGTVTYTPDSGFTGTDNFPYTISDGRGGSDSADVTVTVSNNPPDAGNDTATTQKNTPVSIVVVANDSDPNGDPLTVTTVTDPPQGTATNNGNGTVTYEPDPGFVGTDSFSYTVCDNQNACDTATVTVQVVQDEAAAVTLSGPTEVFEGSEAAYTATVVDPDPADTYTFSWILDRVAQPDATGDTFSVTYSDGSSEHTVSVVATDDDGASSAPDTVETTVVNVAPTVSPQPNRGTKPGIPLSFIGEASDPAGANDPLTFTWSWGDGSSDTVGRSVEHVYRRNGVYTASLTVDDGDGGFASTSFTVAVSIGYWLVASDGGIFAFGDAQFFGSTGNIKLNQPIVGMASTPSGNGYWFVASDGGVFTFGDAGFFGSTGAIALNEPIVGMASTPSGNGYWLVASDGGIFPFGDAKFFGSTGAIKLNQPIVGMASTPTGSGYWLVASDGGIFAFGDAKFFGSTGNIKLNQPIVGMTSTPSGNGYWFVAADGGIFAFGDAGFFGSTGAITLNQPIVGMDSTPTGKGYWLVASDGGIFAFGDAPFKGSTGNIKLNQPIVGMSALG